MPITRRPETQGEVFDPYIRSLWDKKWKICGLALLAGVITYIALGFVPEKFRVTSEIFVNQFSSTDEETPNPETVSTLLKSQGVL